MSGERGLNCDLRGFQVANFADHDDIGVVPQDGAQQTREIQPDLRLYLDLRDPGKLILNRIFDRDDVAFTEFRWRSPA